MSLNVWTYLSNFSVTEATAKRFPFDHINPEEVDRILWTISTTTYVSVICPFQVAKAFKEEVGLSPGRAWYELKQRDVQLHINLSTFNISLCMPIAFGYLHVFLIFQYDDLVICRIQLNKLNLGLWKGTLLSSQ